MGTCLDSLPTVISCCFCCFLRAGTAMIAVFSFLVGLLFAPNISYAKGFWQMESVLSNYSVYTESAVQIALGVVSIFLCVVSVLLLVGAFCNMPRLILVYQYGAIVYSGTVVLTFFVLAMFCFFVHDNCTAAGGALCGLILLNVALTGYFLIVTNSLRVSLMFLRSEEYKGVL